MLVAAQLVDNRNQESQHDEGTRREHEEQDVVGLGQQGESKNGARTQQFTTDAQQGQSDGETKTDTNTIEERGEGRVLGSKALSTSEDDTVDNNQGNKQSKGSVNVGQESLDDKLQHGDEGCNNHDEYGDANLVGGNRLQA